MSLKLDGSNESGSKTRQVKNGETESRMYKKPKNVKKRKKKKKLSQFINGRKSKVERAK